MVSDVYKFSARQIKSFGCVCFSVRRYIRPKRRTLMT